MARRKRPEPTALNWFGYTVGIVILLAFIASLVVSLRGGPCIPVEIYVLMGTVAGAVFGATVLKRNGR